MISTQQSFTELPPIFLRTMADSKKETTRSLTDLLSADPWLLMAEYLTYPDIASLSLIEFGIFPQIAQQYKSLTLATKQTAKRPMNL